MWESKTLFDLLNLQFNNAAGGIFYLGAISLRAFYSYVSSVEVLSMICTYLKQMSIHIIAKVIEQRNFS